MPEKLRDIVRKTANDRLAALVRQVDKEWPWIEADVCSAAKRGQTLVQCNPYYKELRGGVSPPPRHEQKRYCKLITDKFDALDVPVMVYIDQRNGYGQRDYLMIALNPEPSDV